MLLSVPEEADGKVESLETDGLTVYPKAEVPTEIEGGSRTEDTPEVIDATVRELKSDIPWLSGVGINVRQQMGEQLLWYCDCTKKYMIVFSLILTTRVFTPSMSVASSLIECSIALLPLEQGGEEDIRIEVTPSTGKRR